LTVQLLPGPGRHVPGQCGPGAGGRRDARRARAHRSGASPAAVIRHVL